MATYLHDPAILICVGLILFCTVLLLVAIGKLFKKSADHTTDLGFSNESASSASDSLFGARRSDALENTPEPEPDVRPEPKTRFTPPIASQPATPPVSKEISERLEEMTKRLSEMQTVLQRQVSNPASTPLTAETIDQLLKIIGNVTLQVDILQRSFGATLSAAPKPLETVSAAAVVSNPPPSAAKPTPAPSPVSTPASSTTPAVAPNPSGKSIGVAGGALSGLARPGTKPGMGPGSSSPASNTPDK